MVQVAGADRALGLWTDFAGLAMLAAQSVQHDIYLMIVAERLGEQIMRQLPPAVLSSLNSLWTWPAGNEPSVQLPPGAPAVEGIIAGIAHRLAADPVLAEQLAGGYEFRLSGGDGGKGDETEIYHLDLRQGARAAGQGPLEAPDLVLTMTAADFRALAIGALPPGAVYVPGRIRITGDQRLAARLRQLLGT